METLIVNVAWFLMGVLICNMVWKYKIDHEQTELETFLSHLEKWERLELYQNASGCIYVWDYDRIECGADIKFKDINQLYEILLGRVAQKLKKHTDKIKELKGEK